MHQSMDVTDSILLPAAMHTAAAMRAAAIDASWTVAGRCDGCMNDTAAIDG